MSILSYNISWTIQKGLLSGSSKFLMEKCFEKYNNRYKCSFNSRNLLLDICDKYPLDIIGLQECIDNIDDINDTYKSTIYTFYNPLKSQYKDRQYRYVLSDKIKNKYGNNVFNMIIYSYKSMKEEPECYTINSSNNNNDIRPVLFAYFKINKLLVINCHLPHNSNFIDILDRLADIIYTKYDCTRIVMLGDFNLSINELPTDIEFINKNNNSIILKIPSYSLDDSTCCWDIDYDILSDIILDSKNGGQLLVIEEENGELASDHRPILLNYTTMRGGGKCGICGEMGHNRRTCPMVPSGITTTSVSHPIYKVPEEYASVKSALVIADKRGEIIVNGIEKKHYFVKDLIKTPINKVAPICGLIYNYRNKYYSISLKNILNDSSVFKLVFNGYIRQINNLVEYDNDFIITNNSREFIQKKDKHLRSLIKLKENAVRINSLKIIQKIDKDIRDNELFYPLVFSDMREIVVGIENIKSVEKFTNELQIATKMGDLNIGPKIYAGCHFKNMIEKKMLAINIHENINIKQFDKESRKYKFISEFLDGLEDSAFNVGILVMEPLTSGTFKNKCRNRTDTIGSEGQKCNQICSKIKEMHDHNIIHNDIHQDNILFNKNNEPRIIDYGQSLDLTDNLIGHKIKINGRDYNDIDTFIRTCYIYRDSYSNFVSTFMEKVHKIRQFRLEGNIAEAEKQLEIIVNKSGTKYNPKTDFDFGIIILKISKMNETVQKLYTINIKIINLLSPFYIISYKGHYKLININALLPYYLYRPVC